MTRNSQKSADRNSVIESAWEQYRAANQLCDPAALKKDGWVTLSEFAEIANVSRVQAKYKACRDNLEIKTFRVKLDIVREMVFVRIPRN
jgi:hypothetical protein